MVTRLEIVDNPTYYLIDHWNAVLRECRTVYDANAWLEYMKYNSDCRINDETRYILHQIAQQQKNDFARYHYYDNSNGQNIFNSFYPSSP